VASFIAVTSFSSTLAFDTDFFPQTAAGVAGDLRMLTQFSIYNPTGAEGQVAMLFYTGPEAAQCWTKILSNVPLQVSATYGLYEAVNPGLTRTPFVPIWEAAVLPAAGSHQVSFPVHRMDNDVADSVDTTMGFGIANVGGSMAEVTARLFNSDGTFRASEVFNLANRAHKAELLQGVELSAFRLKCK